MRRAVTEVIMLAFAVVISLIFLVFAPSLARKLMLGGFGKLSLAIGAMEAKLRGVVP